MSSNCTVIAASACRAIVQSFPHAVVLLDEYLRVVLTNRAASALFVRQSDRLRGVEITQLIPHENLGVFLRDFGSRRTKMMEIIVPLGRNEYTVNVTAVRLGYRGVLSRGSRIAAGRKRDFTLLLLHDITEKTLLEQQLIAIEKQAAIGQLAAGILHEVSNPLAGLDSNLRFVGAAMPAAAASVRQALDASLEQIDEVRQLLGILSAVPRRLPRYARGDLHDVLRRCGLFIAREAKRRGIRVAMSTPSPLPCEMDAHLIRQVLLNIFKNAMEAMPAGGRIVVRTSLSAPRPDEPLAAVIEMEDTGVGIPDADLRKVFRPLFSTKPGGAGLGLSFCRQVVEEHGGWIRLGRGTEGGTVVTISLPLEQAALAAEDLGPDRS